MIVLLLVALAAVLVVPPVLRRRGRIAAWSPRALTTAWLVAALPEALLAWMIAARVGREWVLLPGAEWVAFALFELLLALLLGLAVALPAAAIIATGIWLRARRAHRGH